MSYMNLRPRYNMERKLIPIGKLVKIIAKTENIKREYVADTLRCFSEIVIFALSNGYTIKLPTGEFYPQRKKGVKKGDIVRIPFKHEFDTSKYDNDELRRLFLAEDGMYYFEYLKDSSDYVIPAFKFYKRAKDRMKEATQKWQ